MAFSQDRKLMPKFVLKDMEALFVDETRSSINLLIANLESVPVNPKGAGSKKSASGNSATGPNENYLYPDYEEDDVSTDLSGADFWCGKINSSILP